MKCWLAFGCSNEEPSVRDEGEADWPPTELHRSVAHVYLEDHGDEPGLILIKTYATSEEAARAAWHKAKERIPMGGFIK